MASLKFIRSFSVLLLFSSNALAQVERQTSTCAPAPMPWAPVAHDDTALFNSAVRFGDGWLAVGNKGTIATVRNGITTYLSSPLRENWGFVSVAPSGELFVSTSREPATVAIHSCDGNWQHSTPTECSEVQALQAQSGTSAWLVCDNRVLHWDGRVWQRVSHTVELGLHPRLVALGSTIVLLGSPESWQLEPDRIRRFPLLNRFSAVAGRGGVPEWGLRNSEVLRIRGNTIERIGRFWSDGPIVSNAAGTVFVSRWDIKHVRNGRLVHLGARGGYDFAPVAVEPKAQGAVVLTEQGQEIYLTEEHTLRETTANAAGGSASVEQNGMPSALECVLEKPEPPDEVGASGTAGDTHPITHRHIFSRGNQRFALAYRDQEFRTIDAFDGHAWKPLVGREVLAGWKGEPRCIGGGPEPDSDLWFAGCGYLVHRVQGRLSRYVLGSGTCLTGFFQSSNSAFFYGGDRFVLRQHGDEWLTEPTPEPVHAMCQMGGRVFAVPNEEGQELFVRRERGYFAGASSDGSVKAAVAGYEFGRISGLAGSLDDAYVLVHGRVEHYDGHKWTELHTDSGLGLTAIAYANGRAVALGEDGFVHTRARGEAGHGFARGPHLEGTSVFASSPTDASVATGDTIHHFDGTRWSAQPVVASGGKTKKKGERAIVGFARWQGRSLAFDASGRVLALDAGQWRVVPSSDIIAQAPKVPDASERSDEGNADARHSPFEPCAVLQPNPESVVLVSCRLGWVATLKAGHWSSYPLDEDLNPSAGCLEGDGCYLLTTRYPLRAPLSAF